MKRQIVWTIFLAVTLLGTLHAVIVEPPDKDEQNLKKRLLRDYDSAIRPVLHKEDRVNVTFGLSLHQIIQVIEKEEKIVCVLWLRQKWMNPLLAWNKSEFGGIKEINVEPQSVWKPDIIFYTNIDDGSDGSMDKFTTKITLQSDGLNKWLAPTIVKSSCKIDVTSFPFDEQHCVFKFGSWTYDGFRVDVQLEASQGMYDKFITNGEWDLIAIPAKRNVQYYVCCPEPYPDLTYTIIIRRRTMYFWFNLIAPCLLITALTGLSFWLPSDCGERIGLVITNLLALSMFMLLVADFLPTTSEVIPLISMYFGGTFFIVGLGLVITCLSLRCHFGAPMSKDVPMWIRIVVFEYIARAVRYPRELVPRKLGIDESSSSKTATSAVDGVTEDGFVTRYRKLLFGNDTGSLTPKPVSLRPFMGYGTPEDNPYGPHTEPRHCCPCKCHYDGSDPRKFSRVRVMPYPLTVSETSFQSTTSSLSQTDGDHSRCIQALRKQLAALNEAQEKIVQYSERLASKADEDEENASREDEWKTVAAIIDRMFLFFFIFVLFLVTVVIFIQAPTYTHPR